LLIVRPTFVVFIGQQSKKIYTVQEMSYKPRKLTPMTNEMFRKLPCSPFILSSRWITVENVQHFSLQSTYLDIWSPDETVNSRMIIAINGMAIALYNILGHTVTKFLQAKGRRFREPYITQYSARDLT